jgi:hypothetical protein
MRSILVIALLANIFLSAWSSNLELAIASQGATVSIGPVTIPGSPNEAPTQQYLGF